MEDREEELLEQDVVRGIYEGENEGSNVEEAAAVVVVDAVVVVVDAAQLQVRVGMTIKLRQTR